MKNDTKIKIIMPEGVRDRPTKSHEYLFLLLSGGAGA